MKSHKNLRLLFVLLGWQVKAAEGCAMAEDLEEELEATRGKEMVDEMFESMRKRWRAEEGVNDGTPDPRKLRRCSPIDPESV